MDSKVWSYLLTLMIGIGFGYVIGNSGSGKSKEKEPTVVPASVEEENKEIVKELPTKEELTAPEPEAKEEEEVEETSAENEAEETVATNPSGNSTLPETGACFKKEEDFSLQLTLFAEDMERQKLEYDNQNPSRLQDCSGIFHRVVKFVKIKM